jgi:hypothetical protein
MDHCTRRRILGDCHVIYATSRRAAAEDIPFGDIVGVNVGDKVGL